MDVVGATPGPGPIEQLGVVSDLLDVIRRMNATPDLTRTMEAVADGIVGSSGFGIAVINFLRSDGKLEVIAISGPDEARDHLLGQVFPAADLLTEMEQGEWWGRICFLPSGTVPSDAAHSWLPDLPEPVAADDWDKEDGLMVPMYGPAGDLLGIISVDVPESGKRPGAYQLQLLELLTSQAEVAIGNARLAQRLRASEQSFRLAFDRSAVGMALVSLDPADPLRILECNAALALNVGRPLGVGGSLTDLLDADDRDALMWRDAIAGSAGDVYRVERNVHLVGQSKWLSITASELPHHSSDSPQAIVQVEDVTARHELEATSVRDPLTGLANRSSLKARLVDAVQANRTNGTTGAVLFCDLDDFKKVNDSVGHATGDALLVTCASRLEAQVRSADFICRLGGDEFVIVLRSIRAEELDIVVQRIRASIAQPMLHEGHTHRVGVSVGSAIIDGTVDDVDRLLAAADAAMYLDKRSKQLHKRRESSTRRRAG